jgi:NitT/TauT family transport system ATP-binding protein
MAATPTPRISLRGVTKEFQVRPTRDDPTGHVLRALEGVTLDVAPGEFLTLVGPSGSGKTSLLDILGGLSQPTEGQVLVDGRPVTGPGLDRGIVFQQYALFPWRTALANVAFGLEAPQFRDQGLGKKQRLERAREYLALVGLSGFEERYPHELSGGMKQRVAIARSLAYEPGILLIDELLRIWSTTGTTAVFITHGIEEAVYLGQRVAVLSSRPGRLKALVEIDLGDRAAGADRDLRSAPEFVAHRHRVWELLRDEVASAQASGHQKIQPDGTERAA